MEKGLAVVPSFGFSPIPCPYLDVMIYLPRVVGRACRLSCPPMDAPTLLATHPATQLWRRAQVNCRSVSALGYRYSPYSTPDVRRDSTERERGARGLYRRSNLL